MQKFSHDNNNISRVYKLRIHDSVNNSNKFEEIQSAVNDLLSVIRYISATRSSESGCKYSFFFYITHHPPLTLKQISSLSMIMKILYYYNKVMKSNSLTMSYV